MPCREITRRRMNEAFSGVWQDGFQNREIIGQKIAIKRNAQHRVKRLENDWLEIQRDCLCRKTRGYKDACGALVLPRFAVLPAENMTPL